MKKTIFFFTILFLRFASAGAQSKMPAFEDSLKVIGHSIFTDSIEENRVKANYKFIKTLVTSLKEKDSFSYPFESLSDVFTLKKSGDNRFRIFTWCVPNDNGTFRYYGAIQVNNPSRLELYPLVDNTQALNLKSDLSDATLETNQWLGCVYYHVMAVGSPSQPYYILLGWKGKDGFSNHKIIETLSFSNGKAQFGVSVLETSLKSNIFKKRKIFDYATSANVMVKYDNNSRMILFDHLIPLSTPVSGIRVTNVPDLSYDGYHLSYGKWYFKEKLDLKNLPNDSDKIFIDPSKDQQNISHSIKEN